MLNSFERFYKNKERAYRVTFQGEVAKEVLADLRTFCYATKPVFPDVDKLDGMSRALEMARREGKREVFERIMTLLKVDYDAIYDMNEEYPE